MTAPAEPASPGHGQHPGTDGPVTGYSVVLPPGWRRIPVRSGSGEAISAFLEQTLGELGRPRDRLIGYRTELERRLTALVAQARRTAGIDIYLPAGMVYGLPLPASFIVSEGALGAPASVDPAQVTAFLASQPGGAAAVTADGVAGVRIEHTAGPGLPTGPGVGSRRVDYILPVPGGPGRWLIAGFSALSAADPDDRYARMLVELFDAIMSTFQWTGGARPR